VEAVSWNGNQFLKWWAIRGRRAFVRLKHSRIIRILHKNPSEVLLVEDSAGDGLLVGQALAESSTPIHLHIARDGEQALQMLQGPDFVPDLILLDLNIPRISGYAVLASYPLKKTPLIASRSGGNNCSRSFGGSQWIALV
jgi:PleD family two-component response regulator